MKAVLLKAHGDISNLNYEEVAKPVPAAGQVLVKIRATSVNRADLVVRNGYPGLSIPLPHILGGDIVGEVVEVTEGCEGVSTGDRVIAMPLTTHDPSPDMVSKRNCPEKDHLAVNWKYFGMHVWGSYAEYATVRADSLVHLPDNVGYEEATGLGVAGLTAYHAVNGVGKLQPREVFMIWGGSGGMGTIAVQLARAAGATVIATAGKNSKFDTLREYGAHHVFNHYEDDVPAKVKELFPYGVDVVLNYVGPKVFADSFNMLKKGGRMLLCGIITGRETTLNIHMAYLKHLSLHGLYLGTKEELKNLVALAADGLVKTHVGAELPLAEAGKAHELMASGDYMGKIVLKP